MADDGPTITKSVVWNSRDTLPLHFATHIPPGVYTYDIQGGIVAGKDLISCQAYYYFAALPGDSRTINDSMIDCCADPIPALFIMGIAPTTVRLSVMRYDVPLECEATLPETGKLIPVEQTSVGYYATDSSLTAQPTGQHVTFGIGIQRISGDKRVIRVIADYPKNIVQDKPTVVRLDLTPQLIDSQFRNAAGVLGCVKTSSPSRPAATPPNRGAIAAASTSQHGSLASQRPRR